MPHHARISPPLGRVEKGGQHQPVQTTSGGRRAPQSYADLCGLLRQYEPWPRNRTSREAGRQAIWRNIRSPKFAISSIVKPICSSSGPGVGELRSSCSRVTDGGSAGRRPCGGCRRGPAREEHAEYQRDGRQHAEGGGEDEPSGGIRVLMWNWRETPSPMHSDVFARRRCVSPRE